MENEIETIMVKMSSIAETIASSTEELAATSEGQSPVTMEYKVCTGLLKAKIKEYPHFELFALMQKGGLSKAITLDYEEQQYELNNSSRDG